MSKVFFIDCQEKICFSFSNFSLKIMQSIYPIHKNINCSILIVHIVFQLNLFSTTDLSKLML